MNEPPPSGSPGLHRHFGLLHATALNVTMIIGAGVFVTIPMMLGKLPGVYAGLGWLAAGLLMLADGWVWGQLARRLPGSGGTYLYLLESYGRERGGRLMAFLFLWQFVLSGPLEVGSGLAAAAQFASYLPGFGAWNESHTLALGPIHLAPVRVLAALVGVGLVVLLYRRMTSLGRFTLTFWVGVLGVCVWILAAGWIRFNPATAFAGAPTPDFGSGAFWRALGGTMILALYSYLGYYNVCYIGDEVRDPGRTIPRSIMLSALLVCVLFIALHLAMLGTVPWQTVPTQPGPTLDSYSLAGDFMGRIYGPWAVVVVTALLIWSCLGSVFAGLLGYSRIPYAAAQRGHFYAALGRVHPVHHIPHVALLLVGGLTVFWSFFDLQDLISALITTRIVEQFIGQTIGLVLLRRREPQARGWRYHLFLFRCALPLAGWVYVYLSADLTFVLLGLATLATGVVAFLLWSWWAGRWPFASPSQTSLVEAPTEQAGTTA